MTTEISNSDQLIDVCDVIARIEELREEIGEERNTLRDAATAEAASDAAHEALEAFDDLDDSRELRSLEALLSDLKGNGGDEQWEGAWYPNSLIRDSYFVDAMREIVEDISGEIPSYVVVDWEATANGMQMDYSSVEFEGVTYWYR